MMSADVFGEFLGTAMMVLLGNGVVATVCLSKSKGKDGGWLMIAVGWGLAVSIAVYASAFLCPAHLNPAVTAGFLAAGSISLGKALSFFAAQFAGAFAGQLIVYFNYYKHYEEEKDSSVILATFSTGAAIRSGWNNFVSELIATFVLVFVIMTLSNHEIASGMTPLIVGALIVSIGVSLGGATGYAVNPARDLAPRILHAVLPIKNKGGSDWGYAWIPVLAPLAGGILAAFVYKGVSSFIA